jgi:RES domain-containing protein
MIFEESLLTLLEDRGTMSITRTVFRAATDGQPPLRPNVRGARWNPPDVAALYTSLEESTARAEWEYLRASQPLRPRGELNVREVEVRLDAVIDLSDPDILEGQFGISLPSLPESVLAYGPTQAIGGAAAFLGRSAILVPSLRRLAAANLVIFTTNVMAGSESYDLSTGSGEAEPDTE